MNEQTQKIEENEMISPDVGAEQENNILSELDITERLKAELAQMKDQWLRSIADAENLRKRTERDIHDTRKYAATEFAREMINVAENLKRALDSLPLNQLGSDTNPLVKTVLSGVDMTMKELLNSFERFGIKRIDPKGQPFDHNLHQAVAQVEDANVKPGDVSQVVQAGYTIHDRLLRPAMVAVAKAPEGQPEHVDTKV